MTNMGDSIRRRRRGRAAHGAARGGEAAPSARYPIRWSHWIVGGMTGIAIAFGLGWLIATTVLFPKPALARDEVVVPDLSGMTLDEVREQLAGTQLRSGDVREMVNPTAPRGVVVAQDPVPGQRLRPGAQVRLAVSQGPARVVVPELAGMPAAAALELARRIGFEVEQESEPAVEEPGQVLRTHPAAGTQIELPARLEVTVSAGGLAPPDTAPAGPDSARPARKDGLPAEDDDILPRPSAYPAGGGDRSDDAHRSQDK